MGDFMSVLALGEQTIASPLRGIEFVDPSERILVDANWAHVQASLAQEKTPATYDVAGPRSSIYFDPLKVKAAIVSCGGLCPGINDVIRAIYMALKHGYGVNEIYGLHYGYQGLNPAFGHEPDFLEADEVDDIHQQGGSVLSSSRGPQPVDVMAQFLFDHGFNMLFTIGGDGTQRGALELTQEIQRRGLPISVIGIPKSIDNDLSCIQRTFGFSTAVSAASTAIQAAHNEAKGAPNGIGIVKLMGRHSGFIAAGATLAYSEVNCTLVPEVRFELDGPDSLIEYVAKRLHRRKHCVIVVAEGAGQYLFDQDDNGCDASGNTKLDDIGIYLKSCLAAGLKERGMDCSLKYIDPSYTIRGIPATADDSIYCLELGQNAVHAAMAGYTGMLVGYWHNTFTHVPLELATGSRKVLDVNGPLWQAVLQSTGQPDWPAAT